MKKVRPIPKPRNASHFIREWRKYRHLTQEQLAARVDMTAGAISQLENGQINYTQPTLEALAYALSTGAGDLLSRDPNLDDQLAELMTMLRAADAQDQSKALRIVKELLAKAS